MHPPLLLADADQHDQEGDHSGDAQPDHSQREQRVHDQITPALCEATARPMKVTISATAAAAPGPVVPGRWGRPAGRVLPPRPLRRLA
ncbi:hypothetical protein ABZU32_13745 [Sphaerisporangium sp. NPDC005288]|uniref:hypothetical protein n=1 Tax=Sphaerisporangium sp. NPDC005288 TaxID=3155114 RepID=UPI0033AB1F98